MAKTIKGYAAIFDAPAFVPDNRRGRDGGFYETIRRGAFTSALKSGGDVLAVVDHDSSRILGRLSAGNLALSEDKRGLYYVITPPDDVSYVRDLLANIAAGNVRGSSFSFSVDDSGQEWKHSNGQLHRDIRSVSKLSDVSVVTKPVYPATDGLVSARSGIAALEPFELSQERNEKQLRREPRTAPQETSGRSWRDCKQQANEHRFVFDQPRDDKGRWSSGGSGESDKNRVDRLHSEAMSKLHSHVATGLPGFRQQADDRLKAVGMNLDGVSKDVAGSKHLIEHLRLMGVK